LSSNPGDPSPITRILQHLARNPDDDAQREVLYAAVYDELRVLAATLMRRERPGHTLSPTALVNEAYLKMAGPRSSAFENRAHFFGSAARAMRQILVNHAESRNREKRGGSWERVAFTDLGDERSEWEFEIIALNAALSKYAELDERAARVAEMRIFAGLTADEIAQILGVSRRTVTSDWSVARRWLSREVSDATGA
jgi:RNA polymerase sigma factor (TIGR02999 family)